MDLELFCRRDLSNIVLPSTVTKLALFKRKFIKLAKNAEKLPPITDSPTEVECSFCTENKLCKKHSSLKKIDEVQRVAFDSDTCFFLFRDLVFRQCGSNTLLIVCSNIKKLRTRLVSLKNYTIFTFRNKSLPVYESVVTFNLTELLRRNPAMKFGDNDSFELKLTLVSGVLFEVFKDGTKVIEEVF